MFQSSGQRIGGRAVIYLVMVLFIAGFFTWHNRKVREAHNAPMPLKVQPEIVHQSPVGKEASLAAAVDLPRLYVFGDDGQVPFTGELRERLLGKCTLLHIISSDKEMRDYFGIDALPVAILFNVDNDEIGRFQPPLSQDSLEKSVLKLITR